MNEKKKDFKVLLYYPAWQTERSHTIDYDVITHIAYSFAIPKEDGTLRPLRNEFLAQEIIERAHAKGVKVLLAVGGWDYEDVRLEKTFAAATDTTEKRVNLADEIIAMCNQYDFDGIDVDWEYPRMDQPSGKQYEEFILDLSNRLHAQGKLLTSAVISGMSGQGKEQKEAMVHNDKVIEAVDWLNIMAYDGGEGIYHSSYDFAEACCNYWLNKRNFPKEKIVLGVPFYGRPIPASYRFILEEDPEAYLKDETMFRGKWTHYNGVPTMTKKAKLALERCGGIMAWEASEDTQDEETSLLKAIIRVVGSKERY